MYRFLAILLTAVALAQPNTTAPVKREPIHMYFCFGGYNAPISIDLNTQENGVEAVVTLGNDEIQSLLPLQTAAQMQAMYEQYALSQWDGFHGSNPMMLDGESFSFHAQCSDGSTVTASGENRFPANYSAFKGNLLDLVQPMIDEYFAQ